ncbi:hypothetical protein MHPYR_30181 [uncultured Mycobacterium sp.]|uniref:Uncharacterized protein n=1 Tax=uncultured Mycobacterium sp. TaxID=171292 RepID=A0A1Y5PBW0_9MYCO|nr:hypothetical protein MHPYR_30181 [uncultured Mycobacterium sp.]
MNHRTRVHSGGLFIVIPVLRRSCQELSTAVYTGQRCDHWYDSDQSFLPQMTGKVGFQRLER